MSDEDSSIKPEPAWKFWVNPVKLVIALLVVLGLYVAFVRWWFETMPERGQFGDLFGGANAIFSALALAGVIYSMWMQRKELMLQREELKLQRKELKFTREVLEEQRAEMETSRQLQAQPIVNPVFSMLFDPPVLVYDREVHNFDSQYRLNVTCKVLNPSGSPALNAYLEASLVYDRESKREAVQPSPIQALDLLEEHTGSGTSKSSFSFLFQNINGLKDRLTSGDSERLPILTLEIVYKNFLGAYFRIKKEVFVGWTDSHMQEELSSQLESVDTDIATFFQSNRREVDTVLMSLSSGSPKAQEHLLALTESYQKKVCSDLCYEHPFGIRVPFTEFPDSFSVDVITQEQYEAVRRRAIVTSPKEP